MPTLFALKKDKKNVAAARLQRAAYRSLASEVHDFSEVEPMDTCELFTGLYVITLNVFTFNYWLLSSSYMLTGNFIFLPVPQLEVSDRDYSDVDESSQINDNHGGDVLDARARCSELVIKACLFSVFLYNFRFLDTATGTASLRFSC